MHITENSTFTHLRDFLKWLMHHRTTQRIVILLILLNAVTLGMETSPRLVAAYGDFLHQADQTILGFFIIEMIFRITAHGPKKFFSDPWSLFDFFVVAIALIPNSGELSILRTLRILRVLRLISTVPAMRRVVSALIASVSGMLSVGAILLILYYIFAVVATHLFSGYSDEYFGSIGQSMFTLFQVMTLESWTSIARPLMQTHPYAWIFFVVYILTSTFTMLNLFVGVMVNTMGNVTSGDDESAEGVKPPPVILNELHILDSEKKIMSEIAELRKQLADLQTLLARKN